jgi:hypothetical protein
MTLEIQIAARKSKETIGNVVSNISQKVIDVVKRIVAYIVSFSGYFGPKSTEGCHRQWDRTIEKSEAEHYLPYLATCAFVHSTDTEWLASGWTPIPPKNMVLEFPHIEAHDLCFFDPRNGLKVTLVEKGDEVIITFGALKSFESVKSNHSCLTTKQYGTAAANILGSTPAIYSEAEQFIDCLVSHPRIANKKIVFAGQCFGASLASYVALRRKEQAICFNSLQLGAGLQYQIGEATLKNADNYVTHISATHDSFTRNKTYDIFDRVLTALYIRTPGCYGKGASIPSAYPDARRSHEYILGSFMKYLGYSERDKPSQIV